MAYYELALRLVIFGGEAWICAGWKAGTHDTPRTARDS